MARKFIIIMITLTLPILLPYFTSLPIGAGYYAYLYISLISSLSLIFSLFLIATWKGERRIFASFTALTILIGLLGIYITFSDGLKAQTYGDIFLEFAKKIGDSETIVFSLLSFYLPLLSLGIWKTGREIAFLRFRDLLVSLTVLILLWILMLAANLHSTVDLRIRWFFNVSCSANTLLVFFYLLLTRIYRETEAKTYYSTILGFFFLNFLRDATVLGGFAIIGIPVVFHVMSYSVLLAGMMYLYTQDIEVSTFQEVVEEKERLAELYKRVDELREVLSIINQMLRHDVKNKLQVILGYIEIYLIEKDESYLEKAIRAVEETNQYLSKIRDLENAISAEKSILKPINIREVVENVLKFYQIPWNVQGNCYALADEAIYSVIDNIVNNAIKHGKTDRIDVILTDLGDESEIRIIDYGVGIPSEIKKRVFEKRFTLDPKRGSGLGLYVVRKVVERYGGRVWVEDTKPKGATFVLRLRNKPKKPGE